MLPTAEAPGTKLVGRTRNSSRVRLFPRADNVGRTAIAYHASIRYHTIRVKPMRAQLRIASDPYLPDPKLWTRRSLRRRRNFRPNLASVSIPPLPTCMHENTKSYARIRSLHALVPRTDKTARKIHPQPFGVVHLRRIWGSRPTTTSRPLNP